MIHYAKIVFYFFNSMLQNLLRIVLNLLYLCREIEIRRQGYEDEVTLPDSGAGSIFEFLQ